MADDPMKDLIEKMRAKLIAAVQSLSNEVVVKVSGLLGGAPYDNVNDMIVVLCDRRDIEGELHQQLDDETWEELQGMMEKDHSILDDALAILKDEYDIEPTDEDNGEAA